jgi:hypothetical protein
VVRVANLRPIANRPTRVKIVFSRFCAAAAFLVSTGCHSHSDDSVRRYLQLSVALGERDPDSIDYYYGPPEWVAGIRAHPPALPAIKEAALELSRKLQSSNSPDRGFLIKQLNAIAARADVGRGVRVSFDDQARAYFDLPMPAPANVPHRSEVRREIDRLLPGRGSLAARYANFDRRFVVAPERLRAVMDRAMQRCREQSLQRMKVPAGESVSVEYVGNKPWNAYSFYQGKLHSLIRVNSDFPLTVDRVLELACHEGYPGHHVYNTLVDAELVQRQHRLELMVQPTFSPQSFAAEALASYAPAMAFPDNERLQFERDVLFPLANLPAGEVESYFRVTRLVAELDSEQLEVARAYVDGRMEWTRAAAALEDRALMADTEATLKYLNEFGSYVLAYTLGRDMVKQCFGKADSSNKAADKWALYERFILGTASIRGCAAAAGK